MKAGWRSIAVIPVLGIAIVLSSCSGDQSGLITSPSNSLDRRIPFTRVDEPLRSCEITALDYFGDGGAMPFEVSCEDMGDATVEIAQQNYSDGGCMIGVRGVVSFPNTSGHQYQFTATTGDCQHDGGTLQVCSTELGGCVKVSLPMLKIVQPGNMRSRMN